MKILLTGGCGYVGSVLVPRLLQLGHEIRVIDIMWFGNSLQAHPHLEVIREDIRNWSNIPMDGMEVLIHLANVANDPCCELSPKLSWEVNVLATMGLAECAIKSGIRQFLYASSGSVYGVKDEEKVTEDLDLVPISDYNKTKMISERVLLSYSPRIAVQCIRPATICGFSPRMRLDLSVNMLTVQALSQKKITVFGGNQTRPNIHIEDMIGVYLHFLNLGDRATGVFNAGFENLSILEIARRISQKVPAEVSVSESNDPRSYRLCSDKLLATGFRPSKTVDDGINDVIEAFQSGKFCADDLGHNIKTMKKISGLQ